MADYIHFCTKTIESLKQNCEKFKEIKYPKVIMPEFREDCITLTEVKKRLEILTGTKACALKMIECAELDSASMVEASETVSRAIYNTKKLMSFDDEKITPEEDREIKKLLLTMAVLEKQINGYFNENSSYRNRCEMDVRVLEEKIKDYEDFSLLYKKR